MPKPNYLGPYVKLGDIESLPEHVQKTFKGYESVKWRGTFKGQSTGTKAGGKFENKKQKLPLTDACGHEISYKEYDINNKKEGEGRDAERFVIGSDGSVYYTDTHYEGIFIKIR